MREQCSRTVIRRAPEQTLLHAIVREHLETFLTEVRERGAGQGLPSFVERELREFLSCGTMARGFARFQCNGCRREILVAFLCKAPSSNNLTKDRAQIWVRFEWPGRSEPQA